jgi:aminodeoxyfutalosine synthase
VIDEIRKKVRSGVRLTRNDALQLFGTDDIFTLGDLAAYSASLRNSGNAYYIRNIHINPTNICVNRCRFCAFSRTRGEDGAYELTIEEILRKIGHEMPISEAHIVGGLHPDWPFEHYLEILLAIRERFPEVHLKAFTATEVEYFSRISGKPLDEVLRALKESGLGTMPGGGAEIFNSAVRSKLCPEKLSGEGWLRVMEAAHAQGIKTNATMLYGHLERYEDRVGHLLRLRELQDTTRGFQAFIPLSYHPLKTDIGGVGASGLDDLKTVAVSRLVLDNIPHIKAYWVMLGEKISQLALLFGADDLDGTVIDEKITYAAGGVSRKNITEEELVNLIKATGRTPVERDSYYNSVRKSKAMA